VRGTDLLQHRARFSVFAAFLSQALRCSHVGETGGSSQVRAR
jgi:hypothetical protein